MFRNTLSLLVVIAVLGLVGSFAFGSTGHIYYSDGPWKGTVIDSETREPIEGAVVVAVWERRYAGPAGPYSSFLDAVEVPTDKDGRFLIPKFWKLNLLPIISWIEGPTFQIFKPGYTAFPGPALRYFDYFPKSPLGVSRGALADLFKKGVVVEVLKLKTRQERLDNIPSGPFAEVRSEKLPLLFKSINEENKELGLKEER